MAQVNYINIKFLDERTYRLLFSAASEKRRKKAEKYIHRDDALRCILSEAMFRYALSMTGRSTALESETDDNGKPFVRNENFKFNVSHAGKYVAVAYSDTEIGVDVDKIFIDSGRELVAKYYYTETEYDEIFKDGIEENNALQFTQIWTMKESYLKYLGSEKNKPLPSFTADRHNGLILDSNGDITPNIRLFSACPDPEYCISVCSEDENVIFNEISAAQLLSALSLSDN